MLHIRLKKKKHSIQNVQTQKHFLHDIWHVSFNVNQRVRENVPNVAKHAIIQHIFYNINIITNWTLWKNKRTNNFLANLGINRGKYEFVRYSVVQAAGHYNITFTLVFKVLWIYRGTIKKPPNCKFLYAISEPQCYMFGYFIEMTK